MLELVLERSVPELAVPSRRCAAASGLGSEVADQAVGADWAAAQVSASVAEVEGLSVAVVAAVVAAVAVEVVAAGAGAVVEVAVAALARLVLDGS